MSGMIGLNFPADARLAPQFGALLGARWLRVVLKPDIDLTPWIQDAHARGRKVLGVIARESLVGTYAETAVLYRSRYGGSLDALQVGNESDHISGSSWTMDPAFLNQLLLDFNIEFSLDTTIVGPGLVSGDPHYLDAVDLDLVDAISLHPYGRFPSEGGWGETPGGFGTIEELIDAYEYHGKRIWVTEIGVSTHEVSEAFQARYVAGVMTELLTDHRVDVACWFAADDQMVPEFGLYDDQGNPKPSAAAFIRASGYTPQEDPMAQFVLGFKDVADANSDIVGNPLEDEYGFTEGMSFQRTENGLLFWADVIRAQYQIGFIGNDGTRYAWDGSALQEVAA